MEDHQNTCRLAVTAAFARGMPNFPVDPPRARDRPASHGLPRPTARQPRSAGRRRPARTSSSTSPTGSTRKRPCWPATKANGPGSTPAKASTPTLQTMHDLMHEVGRMSGRFTHAEGWRKHHHPGFCDPEADPLIAAIGEHCWRENDETRNSKFEGKSEFRIAKLSSSRLFEHSNLGISFEFRVSSFEFLDSGFPTPAPRFRPCPRPVR